MIVIRSIVHMISTIQLPQSKGTLVRIVTITEAAEMPWLVFLYEMSRRQDSILCHCAANVTRLLPPSLPNHQQ